MNPESLKKVLQSLREVKACMRDVANASVVSKLDEAIELLERSLENKGPESEGRQKALEAIGALLKNVPAIIALIKLLSGNDASE